MKNKGFLIAIGLLLNILTVNVGAMHYGYEH